MKKLNNKGFAISTVIYGLSVMSILIMTIVMGTMANNRANSKEISKSIERDLNSFSRTEMVFTVNADGTPQEYVVPPEQGGWYKIELWGAQGGGERGGLGAYTSGIIELKDNEVLYFNVGRHPSSGSGQSTDVRLESDSYDDLGSASTRIMVAGGGGSGEGADGGTLVGYTLQMRAIGGYINSTANGDFSLHPVGDKNPTNGTLVGYPSSYVENTVLSTVGSPKGVNNGGDGYFPGTSSDMGGSSFISGYAGCQATDGGHLTNGPKYSYKETTTDENGNITYSGSGTPYYFVDGNMIPGVNSGDGYAKVERVAIKNEKREVLVKKNDKLNNVKVIRDCVDSTTTPDSNKWKISAIFHGDDLAVNTNVSSLSGPTTNSFGVCKTLTLDKGYDLDEVAVFHGSGRDYKNHTIEVQKAGESSWSFIKGKGQIKDDKGQIEQVPFSETESVAGIHISAYQYDSTERIPATGNYYILPVLSSNKVMTAIDNTEKDTNAIQIDYLLGKRVQKWSIERILNENITPAGVLEYKIVELSGHKALAINLDENIVNNRISATTIFNRYMRNPPQIWKIETVGNGTYLIRTVVDVFDSGKSTGNILPQTNQTNTTGIADNGNSEIVIGRLNSTTERFKLIAIDYSTKMQK